MFATPPSLWRRLYRLSARLAGKPPPPRPAPRRSVWRLEAPEARGTPAPLPFTLPDPWGGGTPPPLCQTPAIIDARIVLTPPSATNPVSHTGDSQAHTVT